MVRHIVMLKFLDTAQGRVRVENVRIAEGLLRELPALIPSMRSSEIGVNVVPGDEAYDIAFTVSFASKEDLQAYTNHPDHQRVAGFLRSVRSARAVVDYEY